MIEGIGIDVVEIDRIQRLFNIYESKFSERLLTTKELTYFITIKNPTRKVEWLAGRFAAKEAISKAIGTGIQHDLTFKDIEILPAANGKPIVTLHKKGEITLHLSITHTQYYAQALAIVEIERK